MMVAYFDYLYTVASIIGKYQFANNYIYNVKPLLNTIITSYNYELNTVLV